MRLTTIRLLVVMITIATMSRISQQRDGSAQGNKLEEKGGRRAWRA